MRITIDEISEVVCKYYFITKDEINGFRRKHAFSHPRQIAMFLAREYTDASTPLIGKRFGGKDHTTVLYAVEMVGERFKTDAAVRKDLIYFRNLLDERKSLNGYDEAWALAWQTWAFIHRPQFMERSRMAAE